MINVLLGIFIVDTILRGILFNEIGIKWWKAIIPLYNKFVLGKEVEDSSLGLILAILTPIFYTYYIFCLGVEMFILRTYSTQATIGDTTKLEVLVPKSVATLSLYTKYWLLVFIVGMVALWLGLMYKFSKKYTKKWSTILWIIPPIGYLYSILHLKKVGKR